MAVLIQNTLKRISAVSDFFYRCHNYFTTNPVPKVLLLAIANDNDNVFSVYNTLDNLPFCISRPYNEYYILLLKVYYDLIDMNK